MIYTSGSTGRPKGVMIQHRAMMNFLQFTADCFHITEDSRLACHCNFSFDVSVESLFGSLMAGGMVFIVSEETRKDPALMRAFIREHGINGGSYPTQFGQLLGADEPLDVDYFCIAGEKMNTVPKVRGALFNGYGPTEFTVYSTVYQLDKEKTYRDIPIGRPAANCSAYVTDAYGNLMPRGMTGELCLAGPQLALGYWKQEELTEEKFRPLGEESTEMVYHTGDLVRWDEEGNLIYAGRMDFQVKLRGYRIELGEIESAALRCPGVTEALALVKNEQICLYFTCSTSAAGDFLRPFLEKELASYMVPSVLMQLPSMPVNANGKIDRAKLPEPEAAFGTLEMIPPKNQTEQQLFALAASILGTEHFGVTDNLVSLGLSSLDAMKLSAAAEKQLGAALRVAVIMKHPFIRSLAQELSHAGAAEEGLPQLKPYPLQEFYPLTENQMGVYLDWELHRTTTQYNIPFVFRFDEEPEVLCRAVKQAAAARSCLRAQLVLTDEGVVQRFRRDGEIQVEMVTLDHQPDAGWFQEQMRPFDLLKEPLYRFMIADTPAGTFLFMDIHHIIFDGLSADLFLEDIRRGCLGIVPEEETVSFFDYALYEKELTESRAFAAAEQYFDGLLQGVEPHAVIFSGETQQMPICGVQAEVSRRDIRAFCSRSEITEGSFWHAVFGEVMFRLTREPELLYVTASSGRAGVLGLENTAGMFVRTVPVVLHRGGRDHGSIKTADYAAEVHAQLQESYAMDLYPYTRMVDRHKVRSEIMFLYQGGLSASARASHAAGRDLTSDTAKFPLEVTVYSSEDRYTVAISCDGYRFSEGDIRLLAEAMVHGAQHMVQADTLGEVCVLSHDQQQGMMEQSTGAAMEYDTEKTWVDYFCEQADAAPEAPAVTDSRGTLTYRQLDEQSDCVAAWLLSKGLAPEQFVAVKMDRRKEFAVAALGIHKAGGAYVAIDLTYPKERIRYLLQDSEAAFVLDEALVNEIVSENPQAERINHARPDGLAYMAYTSGSTGNPKGIMIPHRAMLNFVQFIVQEFQITEESRLTCHCSFSSDVSLESIFTSLICGANVFLVPEEIRRDVLKMRRYIRENRITGGSYFTQFGQLLGADETLDLDYIALIGEKMTAVPNITGRVYNTYGPTEFIEATYYLLDSQKEYDDIPVGRPMHNCTAVILDSCGQLLPAGIAGEICLAGPQMARGYWKLPEKTAEVFTVMEHGPLKGMRVYHTGDLGRWNRDGELEFLGRIDFQVKLRGYRIEPGEVEARAAKFPGILQEVAVVRKDRLCLYYTADRDIDEAKLRRFLGETLASYMVPSEFLCLEEMPLTPNGKIRREALPDPVISEQAVILPATETEEALFAIAAGLLKTDAFGVESNLISLGMSSLGAMKLSVAVRQELGRELSVADIMRQPEIRALAVILQQDAAAEEETLCHYPEQAEYPLAENQRGVYLECMREPASTRYNLPVVCRFDGKEPQKLAEAVGKAAAAHTSLSLRMREVRGEVAQYIEKEEALSVPVTFLDHEPETEDYRSRIRPFDLAAGPLVRAEILVSPASVYLFLDFHHLVFDGISADIFLADVLKAYNGEEIPPEQITAADAALYEQSLKETGTYREAEGYFDGLLAGAAALSYPASAAADGEGPKRVIRKMSRAKADAFLLAQGITASSFWHSAFAEALYRLTREESFLYLTVSSGRSGSSGLDRTTGMFARTIPVVYRKNVPDTSVNSYLHAVHDQLQETISRDFYPYTALSERFGLRGEVMFLYQGALMEGGNLQERVTFDLSGDQVKFPLDIIVYPEGDSYTLCLEYDGALYSREDMELLAGAVVHMAENLTDAETVNDASVLSPAEEQAVKELSKGEALEYDRTKTWVDLFLEQAAARPQKTAVSDGSTSLTYRELDALSDRFAAYLLAQGIAPDDFVAVRMDRVKEISVVLLGIHKAGAAYVPFDLDCPQERADFMLSDSGAKLLVTEDVVKEALAEVTEAAPVRNMTPENIAYMIYTSGSTGTPKGVMIQHKALMNFTQFICAHFGLTAESHISCHVNFAFDASVEDLFPVYTVGGTLYIVPEEIRRDVYLMRQFIVKHRINGGNYSTQFGQLLAADEPLTLDYINLGGEKMTAVPKISGRVFNTYGPTEFTDDSTYFEIDKTKTYRNIPIGRPLYNCTAYVADPCGQLLPKGAVGELCMAGPQMAKGYWNRPELTAEKFRVLGTSVPEMVYHTGDLVRWNSEDQLEYLGRMDFQVKLRGYRIELGEIESAAMNYPPVKIAAAEVRKEQICLYFEASEDVDTQALGAFMERTLSDYMVPSAFVQLVSMPLNQNGKIDRKKLPDPVLAQAQCTAPATPLEEQLFDCAAEILGHSAFGVTDDLIAVGMSSLGAMRFSAALAREHDLAVRVADIMRTPVIRVLAEALKQGGEAAPALQVPSYPARALYPLTHNQLGVYLDWEMSPGTTEYNNPFVYGFADVSEGQLKDAVRRVMETHPYLMTTLVMEGSTLMQKPGNPEDLQIAVSHVAEAPEPVWFQQKVRPFDLHNEPLYRLEIVASPSGIYLFADFHHIIYDGLSGDLFLQDLIRALAGEKPAEEEASAFDYALYEQELLAGEAFAKAEAYFHDLAAGAAAVSWPVSDIPDGTAVGVVRKTVRRAEIEEFCRKERITASSCWHAAFAEALQRLTRAEMPLYTTVSNGRLGDPGLEHTAGMFAKTLPVVLRETGEKHGDETVSSFVGFMHRQLLDSFAQDYYPFAKLVEKFGIRPEIMFNYRSDMLEAGEQGEVVIHALMPDKVKFPLELTVYPQGQDFVLIIEYDGHMYGAADMELLAGAIVCAAQNLTRAERVRDVALVSEEEQQRILMHSKGMEFAYDATETWLDLFFRQTDAAPDRMAVADDHSSMTYAQLDEQSDRFAAWLIQQGVKPDDFVVVRMGRVKEFMVAVLGIHKAGAAYVPIDLEYPPERVAYMQENADARIIVSEELIEQALLQVPQHPGRICLAGPDNTAYMIYTSGSTGKPKGVMIPHRGLLNFVHCIRHSYEITEDSRITLMKNFAFDASIEDMYPVLTKGGVLFIINEEVRHDIGLMLEFVKANQINGGGYPTQFGQLMAAEESLKVQYLTAGGEA
ncbi:MAG: amino acid adenylation domain-containing protein, partial [Anaerovoracaceae bacterium]